MISVLFENESKVTVSNAIKVSGIVYTLKYPCTTPDCTPYVVTFKPGTYQIELWGASGGFNENLGAHGSYTSGILYLNKSKTFYIYLGQKGSWSGPATYNGGGRGTIGVTDPTHYVSGGSGGGASDIRLTNGPWNDFESLKSRINVAAGGAGDAYFERILSGGAGGILIGFGGSRSSDGPLTNSTGGTQTSVGRGSNSGAKNGGFGYGGDCALEDHGSGGGSGYYGGGSGGVRSGYVSSGSGGSSYVSGYEGCKAVSNSSTANAITHEDSSIHYSGISFYSPAIKDGETIIPCPDPQNSSECRETGHYGNGYARITIIKLNLISKIQCHPWIPYQSITVFILQNTD